MRHFKLPRIEQFLRITIGTDEQCVALLLFSAFSHAQETRVGEVRRIATHQGGSVPIGSSSRRNNRADTATLIRA